MTGIFRDLSRRELDALLADSEHAHTKSQVALSVAPLDNPEAMYQIAGVAADCLAMWMEALEESISRWWHGDMPVAAGG